MTAPLFTVVIPAYNAQRTVGSAIRSVLEQTLAEFELVVVDDGSTDATRSEIERLMRDDSRITLIAQENRGTAAARNRGVAEARAGLVSFLDNDDLWLPQYLEQMAVALGADPDAAFAYTDGWTLDDARKRIQRATTMSKADPPAAAPPTADALAIRLARSNFVLSSATVRRAALEELGGFDASVSGSDDWDLWIRVAAAGYRGVRVPGRLVIQRERADSQSKRELVTYRRHREVLRRVAEEYDVPSEARAVAASQLADVDRLISALDGTSRTRAALHRARRLVQRARLSLLPPRSYREPPPEIARAFPDLRAV